MDINCETQHGTKLIGIADELQETVNSGTIRIRDVQKIKVANVTVINTPFIMIGGKSHLKRFQLEEYLVIQIIPDQVTEVTFNGVTIYSPPVSPGKHLYAHLTKSDGNWRVSYFHFGNMINSKT